MSKSQIIMGGLGGQGIILSGIVLAEAAVFDGKYSVQTQNYGPESRGGACRTDVIISDLEIFYPKVQNADIFLALSQEAFNKYYKYSRRASIIIIDKNINTNQLENCNKFDIIKYAYNVIKEPFTVNMISLGIINGLTGIVKNNSIMSAIKKRVPKGTFDVNYSAYKSGFQLTKEKGDFHAGK